MSKILPYYEINQILYNEVLTKYAHLVLHNSPVSCFINDIQVEYRDLIYLDDDNNRFMCRADIINYLTKKTIDEPKKYWKQIVFSLNKNLDEKVPYRKSYQPWFAEKLFYDTCKKYVNNIDERLDEYSMEYEDAINNRNNELIAHETRFGYSERNVIYKYNNASYYDIHKAHAGALIEIFPELKAKINRWNIEAKTEPRKKLICNITVGKLAEKPEELKKECRKLRTLGVVVEDELLARHEKTYYWICNRTRNILRDFESKALGNPGSHTIYANTDGIIINECKDMPTGTEVDTFGLEYKGEVYCCYIDGGWILQYGNTIKSNIELTERFGTDLRIGKVPVMKSAKRIDWQTLEIKEFNSAELL